MKNETAIGVFCHISILIILGVGCIAIAVMARKDKDYDDWKGDKRK